MFVWLVGLMVGWCVGWLIDLFWLVRWLAWVLGLLVCWSVDVSVGQPGGWWVCWLVC